MKENIIHLSGVDFSYRSSSESDRIQNVLNDFNIDIHKGEFVVLLGRNGSGKSTLSRLLNALLLPDKGEVIIDGMSTTDQLRTWDIRTRAGMVFQNPDNQIIATTVEEDIAFGPENLGIQPADIKKRVEYALETVGMSEYINHAPHLLSGGQKQRIAIAGVLAMKPKCIILDEATSMLDPSGRKEVLKTLRMLSSKDCITVIHITHHMDEAIQADRVIIMDEGKIVLDGTPGRVFSNVQLIKQLGLQVPQIIELFYNINKEGYNLPTDITNVEDAVNCLVELIANNKKY